MAKFKVTIERVILEQYEMTLEDDSIVHALDEARALVDTRNAKSKGGYFHVTKIETQRNEK